MGTWQVREAQRRFGEVLRKARDEGPQIVIRHGEQVAVVLAMEEYRRLKEGEPDFKEFLISGPGLSVLEIERSREPIRPFELPVV
ncbi:type II toxin-antitoxin system Phd/YefM family antitoxin [Thermoactinospora rubra]|uniref:type II toxin-antitoxin system Phd/YefM family antitoxin n=1 Tax=Thermoactinospora rubra TaxID=1088767 RepID=UPI000A123161|nr:type II toxin-antitoxin system Phd/YefM family antitoxin [Thermoactinospora rubra]